MSAAANTPRQKFNIVFDLLKIKGRAVHRPPLAEPGRLAQHPSLPADEIHGLSRRS